MSTHESGQPHMSTPRQPKPRRRLHGHHRHGLDLWGHHPLPAAVGRHTAPKTLGGYLCQIQAWAWLLAAAALLVHGAWL